MFEVDNRMNYIEPSLLENGFKKDELTFTNVNCKIVVNLEDENYDVYWRDKNNGNCMVTSDNLNIYWLFGFLSANELINRDFKI